MSTTIAVTGAIEIGDAPPGIAIMRVEPAALAESGAAAALFDVRAFESSDAMAKARSAFFGRALAVVRADGVEEILRWLRPEDDVCTTDEPAILVAHRLFRLATVRDPLTGLGSRAALEAVLARRLALASRAEPISLAVLDIDRFKAVNDEHGHAKGDAVLAELGRRFRQHAAGAPAIGRIGGEVFAVVLEAGERDALERTEALRTALVAEPIAGIALTMSAGVATADRPSTASALSRRAEEARYHAKSRGRDRTIHADALERTNELGGLDPRVAGFEDFTRVIADRVANAIAGRGRRLFDELREQADVDVLTELFSRRYFERRLPFELEHATETGASLVLALLDIDHFGRVNKEHGWPTGDRVLAEVAHVVRSTIRATDWVARYGGEELTIVLAGATLDDASGVLERVRAAFEAHSLRSIDGAPVSVTVSIGAARAEPGDEPLDLVERASNQLLVAKREGRNQLRAAAP